MERAPVWHGLAAGACATAASRLVTYPPDTVKARLQVQSTEHGPLYRSTSHAFMQIYRAEGFRGFYRGFGSILLTVIPANTCYFGGYELGRAVTPRDWGVLSDVTTAAIAQSLAGLVYCPIDVVKQRVQTAAIVPGSRPLSVPRAALALWRDQGLRGFFRGFWTMNALWLPYNMLYIPAYEACKRQWYYALLEREKKEADRSKGAFSTPLPRASSASSVARSPPVVTVEVDRPMELVLPAYSFPTCSALCAAFAAAVTHPVDVVKTRQQVLHDGRGRARPALSVARDLLR
ncbi:hypothetical protein H632_c1463p0, partial [Helicosporidium sp. ATCC 50920]